VGAVGEQDVDHDDWSDWKGLGDLDGLGGWNLGDLGDLGDLGGWDELDGFEESVAFAFVLTVFFGVAVDSEAEELKLQNLGVEGASGDAAEGSGVAATRCCSAVDHAG